MATEVRLDPAKVAKLLRGKDGPVYRRLIKDGELVKAEARRLVGVHTPDPWGRPRDRRPGTLRDSIVKRIRVKGRNLVVEVGSSDPIALFHHEGTQSHEIRPVRAPALVFWKAGEVIHALRVSHPGTKPNRFLLDALRILRGRY